MSWLQEGLGSRKLSAYSQVGPDAFHSHSRHCTQAAWTRTCDNTPRNSRAEDLGALQGGRPVALRAWNALGFLNTVFF